MNPSLGNFFESAGDSSSEFEVFDELLSNGNLRIERIISTGQITPPGQWLEQNLREWVILLKGEAKLRFHDGAELLLAPGDYVLIEKNRKHRVEYTSSRPPCVWLAVHYE